MLWFDVLNWVSYAFIIAKSGTKSNRYGAGRWMSSVFPLRWMVMTQGCCWAEKKASSAVRSAGGFYVLAVIDQSRADRAGIEAGDTLQIFQQPKDKRTEDYITGRFG